MKKTFLLAATAVSVALAAPSGAYAQTETQNQQGQQSQKAQNQQSQGQKAQGQNAQGQNASGGGPLGSARTVSLEHWNYDDLYRNGWGAEQLIDTEVVGQNGEEIGEVENILVGPDGNIRSVIVAAGGFFGLGDAHFAVPWNKVQVGSRMERVTVPITQANHGDYDLFGASGFDVEAKSGSGVRRVEEGQAGAGQPRVWRATELIGDMARLKDRAGYGYVEDLVFDRQGKLMAVLVEPRVTGDRDARGSRAFPFYGFGYGFDPGQDSYSLPYGTADVGGLDRFDDGRMNTAAEGREESTAGSSGNGGRAAGTGTGNGN
ncbi:PRC-barrel domain-containing protein [Azospirillum sp. SYSU D00513]|uniref:PRC-barrel domain-containing protein n=1 Tax=Azospirillum sp. SYSU D00513 TaxID=2812561 RepID=UPI001A96E3CE|nr:PRC-barrel domain-containing protein [Azospirillum sp. SYSU D00513]